MNHSNPTIQSEIWIFTVNKKPNYYLKYLINSIFSNPFFLNKYFLANEIASEGMKYLSESFKYNNFIQNLEVGGKLNKDKK